MQLNTSVAGGGISNEGGTVTINNSYIGDNTAGVRGGGIYNHGFIDAGKECYAIMTITNSIICNNYAGTASSDARGGGIHNHYQYSKLYLYNVTVTNNSVDQDFPQYLPTGGGIYTENTYVWLTNSLIAFNSYKNCSDERGSLSGIQNCLGNNLSSDSSCCGPFLNTDPLLAPTKELLSGSPAIDSADDNYCPATDMRGIIRPVDGDGNGIATCDIGAYEYVPPTLITLSSFTATPSNRKVTLDWTTASEIDNAGFNLYRAESEDGEYVKINATMIPAEGTSTSGATYQYIDKDIKNRATYYCKLEDIDLSGTSTMHGPVSAEPHRVRSAE